MYRCHHTPYFFWVFLFYSFWIFSFYYSLPFLLSFSISSYSYSSLLISSYSSRRCYSSSSFSSPLIFKTVFTDMHINDICTHIRHSEVFFIGAKPVLSSYSSLLYFSSSSYSSLLIFKLFVVLQTCILNTMGRST
jgi:hypothetical protein